MRWKKKHHITLKWTTTLAIVADDVNGLSVPTPLLNITTQPTMYVSVSIRAVLQNPVKTKRRKKWGELKHPANCDSHVRPAVVTYDVNGLEVLSCGDVHLSSSPGLIAALGPVGLLGHQQLLVLRVSRPDELLGTKQEVGYAFQSLCDHLHLNTPSLTLCPSSNTLSLKIPCK